MKCDKHKCELKIWKEGFTGQPKLILNNEKLYCPKCISKANPLINISSVNNAVTALKNLGRAMSGSQYNTNNKWDIRFMQLAKHIASWSKDPSTKVGAVIVDHRHRIVSVGFNGYPQNIPDDDLDDRERKYAKIIHAEMNALLFAQREIEMATIYVWPMAPCSQCASAIIQSGIECVITQKATSEQYERWGDKIKLTEEMFESANVTLEYI